MDRLHALVFSDSYTAPVFLGAFHNIADVFVSWEIPGGVREFGLVIKLSPLASYEKYRRFALQRIVLMDNNLQVVATGDITFLGYGYGTLILKAKGPWWRLYDGMENTQAAASDNTDDVLMQALTDHASGTVDVSDYSNIVGTSASCHQQMSTGTADGTTANKLVHSAATFQTDLIQEGDVAYNSTDGTFASVLAVDLSLIHI